MSWKWMGTGLGAILAAPLAHAQEGSLRPLPDIPVIVAQPGTQPALPLEGVPPLQNYPPQYAPQGQGAYPQEQQQQQRSVYGFEAESLPAELAEDILRTTPPTPRRFGPTPVDQVGFLMQDLGLAQLFGNSNIRAFGWVEGGYTGASGSPGMLSVQPRLNRYGDQFLLNQIGLVLQKPLAQDRWDWGFNIRYFAGADAATGQPGGGIDSPPGNPRFSHDFRDLYVSAHIPMLTEKGVNVKVGRMNTIIGWNGFLAPYRPMYSSDYQFFYSQDGAFTGALAQVIVSDRLDIWNGVTLGANTFFEKRSNNSICYIGQVNYWLTDEQRTRLTASTYLGPNAIFAAPGLSGDFVSMVELRVQHSWSERVTQIVQSNFGWDTNTPVGTGSWFGVYTVGILHATCEVDLISRAEWFRDVRGTRTGIATDYSEVTLGANWHPNRFIEFRPEIRGDFAGAPAFGTGASKSQSQLTAAMSALIKF